MNRLTIKGIITLWMDSEISHGRNTFKNSDMERIRLYGIQKFNIYHNASSYERMFRKLRSEDSIFEWVLLREAGQGEATERVWKVVRKEKNQRGLFG